MYPSPAHCVPGFFIDPDMRYKIIFILLSCLGACAEVLADPVAASSTPVFSGWKPFVELDLWRASDAIPISQIESDWSKGFAPRAGRNVVLMRNRAAAGAESDQWRIGYEVRQEAFLDIDRDTLEMVRLYKQRQDPDAPRTFAADARYKNWSARGLRVGRTFEGPLIAGRAVRTLVSVAWYSGSHYRQNEVSGSISYLNSREYAFNATELDIDSRARLPFLDATPEASGVSISVATEVPLSEALTLKVKVDDLWSRMRWRNLPVTRQTINSDVAGTDSEGFLNYRPLLSGRNQQVDESITLPRYGTAELSYRTGAWRYAAQVERYAGVTIPTLSAARQFGWGVLSARMETRFHTFGLGYEFGNFRVLLQADSIRQDKAKAQAVQLGYSRSF
jgi:hypothetical protein